MFSDSIFLEEIYACSDVAFALLTVRKDDVNRLPIMSRPNINSFLYSMSTQCASFPPASSKM